jgi:HD-GYP domain-containing protein (c-di-GMP phosphodiesterase class II)
MAESTARVDTRMCRYLVNQLYVVLRIVRIHEPNNTSVTNATSTFLNIMSKLTETWDSVTVEATAGCLYANGIRLKMDVSGYASHRYILEQMEKFGMRSITLLSSLDAEELTRFACLMAQMVNKSPSFDALTDVLQENGISSISIQRASVADETAKEDQAQRAEEQAKKVFLNSIKVVRRIMHSASHFEAVKLRRAKRAVQGIVESILHDESYLFGLATIKNHDEYTFNHCVNVCIYSVALGQRLGLSKSRLGQLGMAALFHDLGKVEIPWDVLNKPEGLNPEEWELVKAHSAHGARMIAKLCRMDEQSLRSIIVAYEHHVDADFSGYPKLDKDWHLDLFSRIVRITDAFDAMTTARVYSMIPRNPHDSIRFLLKEAGDRFDPELTKLFASMIGLYPVGTVLQLNTGEYAVVVKPARDIVDIARPYVSVIADANEVQCGGETFSLAETDGRGKYTRSVERVVEADQFGLNVPELLVGPLDVEAVALQQTGT